MSESDEYAIDAARFTDALREQRVARTPGGLYHLNQILMAYNSNRIEGSVLTEDQTRFIYETRTIFASGDEAVPVDDIVETVNSFELLDEMIDRLDAPITAQTMKDYHAILKRGTADARRSWFSVGDFKRMANEVGGKSTVAPEHVSIAIDELLAHTPTDMSFDDITDFHYRFESIHPFQDGNGRVGRILMFQQCLQHGIMPFIVLDDRKAFYYRGLTEYAKEPGFLRDTFCSLQDRYHARFAKFIEVL